MTRMSLPRLVCKEIRQLNLLPTLARIYLNSPSCFVLYDIRVVSRIFLLVVQYSHGVFLNPLVVVFPVVLNLLVVFLAVLGIRVRADTPEGLPPVPSLELLLGMLRDGKGKPDSVQSPFPQLSKSEGLHECRLYHSLRVPLLGHKSCREGCHKVQTDCRCQNQFRKEQRSAVRCLKRWNSLPGPFHWSDRPICIFAGVARARSPTTAKFVGVPGKGKEHVGTWLQRCLSLRGRAEACDVYVFPLILYRLSVLPLPKGPQVALQRSFSKMLWRGRKPWVRRQICCQRPCNRGLGMPNLVSHWLAERLVFLGRSLTWDTVWERKVNLTLISSGLRFGSARRATRWRRFAPNGIVLQVRALLSSDWTFKVGLANVPDCSCRCSGLEEMAVHSFYSCEWVCPFWSHVGEWATHIDPKHFVLLGVSSVVDNVDPPWRDKRMMFLAILAEWWFGRRERKNYMVVQTFLIVIWFFSSGISLESKSNTIENAWTA